MKYDGTRKEDELEFMTVSNEEDDLLMPQSYNPSSGQQQPGNAFGGWIAEHSKVSHADNTSFISRYCLKVFCSND